MTTPPGWRRGGSQGVVRIVRDRRNVDLFRERGAIGQLCLIIGTEDGLAANDEYLALLSDRGGVRDRLPAFHAWLARDMAESRSP